MPLAVVLIQGGRRFLRLVGLGIEIPAIDQEEIQVPILIVIKESAAGAHGFGHPFLTGFAVHVNEADSRILGDVRIVDWNGRDGGDGRGIRLGIGLGVRPGRFVGDLAGAGRGEEQRGQAQCIVDHPKMGKNEALISIHFAIHSQIGWRSRSFAAQESGKTYLRSPDLVPPQGFMVISWESGWSWCTWMSRLSRLSMGCSRR